MADYISREAAIKAINDMYEYEFPAASGPLDKFYTKFVPSTLRAIPAADVIAVVRCGACEFSRELTKTEKRVWLDECRACENPKASQSGYMIVFPEHFCSCGKRRENDD